VQLWFANLTKAWKHMSYNDRWQQVTLDALITVELV
jgi:hypothetical protein